MKYQELVNLMARTQPPKMVFKSLTLPRHPEGNFEFLHCIVEDDAQAAADWALRLSQELVAMGKTSIVNPDTVHQVPVFYNQPINTDTVQDAGILVWTTEYSSGCSGRGQSTVFSPMDSSGYISTKDSVCDEN